MTSTIWIEGYSGVVIDIGGKQLDESVIYVIMECILNASPKANVRKRRGAMLLVIHRALYCKARELRVFCWPIAKR